jgi:hypothetical protein
MVDLPVPALEDEVQAAPVAPVEPTVTAPPTPSAPVASVAPSASAPPPSPAPSSRRRLAAWIGAASLVPLGLGAGFGIAALARQNASDRDCPVIGDRRACSDSGAEANQQARTYARWSDVGLGLGLAGAITAGILYWTAPADHTVAVRVIPLAGGKAGASVIGLF